MDVRARRVWDSRGRPTVEVEVLLNDGASGRGIAPSGKSRGANEAIELRDGTASLGGFDVQNALHGVDREIRPLLMGRDARDQASIDRDLIVLDGTPNKSRLGGNALVAASMAVLHAAASSARLPLWRYLMGSDKVNLPLPQIQIFGGGAHAAGRIDLQDLMVIAVGADSFEEALRMTSDVYRHAGELLESRGLLFGVADEGGWWPAFQSNEEALETLCRAIEKAGYVAGRDLAIALDVAASELRSGDRYRLSLDGVELDSEEMCERLLNWLDRYPIASIEDPFAEDDDDGWIAFSRAAGSRVQIVGDDFLVTNAARISKAAERSACNAALIKPNQAGTVTETREALSAAKKAGMATIVSARSGETEDVTIVHLAAGLDAGQLKVGSFSRSERMCKWNEGIRIETTPGIEASFAGRAVLAGPRKQS